MAANTMPHVMLQFNLSMENMLVLKAMEKSTPIRPKLGHLKFGLSLLSRQTKSLLKVVLENTLWLNLLEMLMQIGILQKIYNMPYARTSQDMDGTLYTDFWKSETNRDIKDHCNIV